MKKNGIGLRIFTITIFSLTLLSFCGRKKASLYPQGASDKVLYNMGKKYLNKKKYEKARKIFSALIELYPRSKYTPRAKLAIADSYYRKGDIASLTLAINEYREFVSLYPYHPKAAYAQLMMGMCYYKQMRKPGRDQGPTLKAIKELEKVVKRYPESQEAKEAEKRLKKCRSRYATHLLLIANFYFRVKEWLGASWRYKEILDKFPDFSKIDEVYYKYGISLYMRGEENEGKAFLSKVITDYPESKWGIKSKRFLEKKAKKKGGKNGGI